MSYIWYTIPIMTIYVLPGWCREEAKRPSYPFVQCGISTELSVGRIYILSANVPLHLRFTRVRQFNACPGPPRIHHGHESWIRHGFGCRRPSFRAVLSHGQMVHIRRIRNGPGATVGTCLGLINWVKHGKQRETDEKRKSKIVRYALDLVPSYHLLSTFCQGWNCIKQII